MTFHTTIIPLLYHYYTILLYSMNLWYLPSKLLLAPRWWTLSPRHLLRVLRLRVRLPGHPMAQASKPNWQMRWAMMIQTLSIYLSTYLSIDLSGYYAYVGMYTLKYIYIYIVYIYVYTYVCIHGCIHSRTYTHKHTHAYIYIHAWPF
jgi:hypothetical protein